MDKDVTYWPTGWKDLTGLHKLPVVTEEHVPITSPSLPSAVVESTSGALPSVGQSNIINKRNQLKRQQRVTHGLGANVSVLPVLNSGPSYLTALTKTTQDMDIPESSEPKVTKRRNHSKQSQHLAVPITAFRIKSPLDKRRVKHIHKISGSSFMNGVYSTRGSPKRSLLDIPVNQPNKTPPPNNDIKFHFMPLPKIAEERATLEPEVGSHNSLNVCKGQRDRGVSMETEVGVCTSLKVGSTTSLDIQRQQATICRELDSEVALDDLMAPQDRFNTRHVYLSGGVWIQKEKAMAAYDDRYSSVLNEHETKVKTLKENNKPLPLSEVPESERRAVSVIELVPFKDTETQDGGMDVDIEGNSPRPSQIDPAAEIIRFSNSVKVKLNKRFEAIRAKSRTKSLLSSALPPFSTKLEIPNSNVSDNCEKYVSITKSSRPMKKAGSVEKSKTADLSSALASHDGSSKRNYNRTVIINSNNQSQDTLISESTFTVSKTVPKQKTYLVLKDRTSSHEDETKIPKDRTDKIEERPKHFEALLEDKDKHSKTRNNSLGNSITNLNERISSLDNSTTNLERMTSGLGNRTTVLEGRTSILKNIRVENVQEYDECFMAERRNRTRNTDSRNNTSMAAVETKRTDYVLPSVLIDEPGTKKVRSKSNIEDSSTDVSVTKNKSDKHERFLGTGHKKSFHATQFPSLEASIPRQANASQSKPIEKRIVTTEMKSNYTAMNKVRTINIDKPKLVPGKRHHRKKQLSKSNRKEHSFCLSESEDTKDNVQSDCKYTRVKSRHILTKSVGLRRSPDYISPNESFTENTLVVQYGGANGSLGDMQSAEDDFQGIPKEEQNLLFELSNINHNDSLSRRLYQPVLTTETSADSMFMDDTPLNDTVTLRDVLSSIADDKPITEDFAGFNSQSSSQNMGHNESQVIGSAKRHDTMEQDIVDTDEHQFTADLQNIDGQRNQNTVTLNNRAGGEQSVIVLKNNATGTTYATKHLTHRENEADLEVMAASECQEHMEIDSSFDMTSLHINKTDMSDNNLSMITQPDINITEPVIDTTGRNVCQMQIVEKNDTQIQLVEVNSERNTTPQRNTDFMHIDVDENEIKSASNVTQESDKQFMTTETTESQLQSSKSMNVDIDALLLSVNSTTNLSSATLQIIQDTVVKYGADNILSDSMSSNVDQDVLAIEAVEASQGDGVSKTSKTVDANEDVTTTSDLSRENSNAVHVEQNADNDEDYMDSNILANNYVPAFNVPTNTQRTPSNSLSELLLEEENHVTFSDVIQVSACQIRPEVKISRPKPKPSPAPPAPPVKRQVSHIRKRHPTKHHHHSKPSPRTTFPPIKTKQASSDLEEADVETALKNDGRPSNSRHGVKAKSQRFRLPSLQAHADAAMSSGLAAQAREDINKVATNIEEMNFRNEQYQERVATYGHPGYIQPRIVLVSSKVPRCNSMKRSIKKDKNVMFIVYDFDKWSFADILDAVSEKLESYSKGCKAHSVLLLCQGGVGYAYMLRNFVLTPQKLKRVDYKPLRDFWANLGSLVSKIKPEEAAINIMGCSLDADKQGRDLLNALRKLIHPLKVRVESPLEGTEEGKVALKQYFHYRRFLLWRSFEGIDKTVSQDPLNSRIDTDRIMTWADLAEDADSD